MKRLNIERLSLDEGYLAEQRSKNDLQAFLLINLFLVCIAGYLIFFGAMQTLELLSVALLLATPLFLLSFTLPSLSSKPFSSFFDFWKMYKRGFLLLLKPTN